MTDRPKLPSLRSKEQTIEMVRGPFDPDVWHAMQERDDRLIEDEIANGPGSRKFVYSFRNGQGVSAIGARELAYQYGGLQHRIISSMMKKGSMMIYEAYAGEQGPKVSVDVIPQLEREADFFKVVVELRDLKTGNSTMAEATEARIGYNKKGEPYEREHFQKIAQSKAYRDAVLHLLPQHIIQTFLAKNLAIPENAENITASVIDQKRKAILTYTAAQGITISREAVESLTMDQIAGLSDAAREKDRGKFTEALQALNLIEEKHAEEPQKRAERPQEHQAKEARRETDSDEEGPRAEKARATAKRPSLFRNEDE